MIIVRFALIYIISDLLQQNKMINAMCKPWHPNHFTCTECSKVLTPENFFEKNGLPYCEDDFHKLFSPKCAGCQRPIKDVNTYLTTN